MSSSALRTFAVALVMLALLFGALAYMMSHGADGLKQVSSDAVLNANYLLARLSDELTLAYDGPCMHEVLFDDGFLAVIRTAVVLSPFGHLRSKGTDRSIQAKL